MMLTVRTAWRFWYNPSWTPEARAEAARPTTYSVAERIGGGKAGVVYLGRNKKTWANVALKTITNDQLVTHRETAYEALRQEYKTGKRIEHPHIVQFLDIAEIDKRTCEGVSYRVTYSSNLCKIS
jgi:serine/threonine protein kinase